VFSHLLLFVIIEGGALKETEKPTGCIVYAVVSTDV